MMCHSIVCLLTALSIQIGLTAYGEAENVPEAPDPLDAAFEKLIEDKLEQAEQEPGTDKADTDKSQRQPEADDQDKPADAGPTEQELRQRMNELERELREARDAFQRRAQEQRNRTEEQQRRRVDQISLPDNPTRAQCEQFIADLREAAKGKRSFSSVDPIVDKLKQIPEEHLDLLMQETAERTTLRYFANYAMRGIDPEVMRERFVKTLEDNPENIGVIAMNGWSQDVRDVVIDHLMSAEGELTPAWFQAAVESAQPGLYPKLHEATINNTRYTIQFLQILRTLPDYDLAHTINACWERAGDGRIRISQTSFATMAAEIGNIEALGLLISQLQSASNFTISPTAYNSRRTNALRFIEFRGSNQETQQWFNKHKDQLVFDHLSKRFVLLVDGD